MDDPPRRTVRRRSRRHGQLYHADPFLLHVRVVHHDGHCTFESLRRTHQRSAGFRDIRPQRRHAESRSHDWRRRICRVRPCNLPLSGRLRPGHSAGHQLRTQAWRDDGHSGLHGFGQKHARPLAAAILRHRFRHGGDRRPQRAGLRTERTPFPHGHGPAGIRPLQRDDRRKHPLGQSGRDR